MSLQRRLVYLLLAAVLLVVVLADGGQPAAPPREALVGADPAADGNEAGSTAAGATEHGTDDVDTHVTKPDPCETLFEAHNILRHLQPTLYAHLDRKLGGSASPRKLRNELGWGQEGPLASAFRLSSRLIASANPFNLLGTLREPKSGAPPRRAARVSQATKERIRQLEELLDKAEAEGCHLAPALRADIAMFPPKGIQQDLPRAFQLYTRYLETESDPHAQFIVGFFYATGLGGAERDQGRATLYYTFSALQGYRPAQMALGYRYWAGIGVKEDCMAALDFYESAGQASYKRYLAGPPGGETLLLTPARLSDRLGGLFGPHASWTLTGVNSGMSTVKAIRALERGESEAEILEYLKYSSDRGQTSYTWRLGHHHYVGSVFPHGGGGVSAGAEEVGEIPQNFDEARRYFEKVARQMWPIDFDSDGKAGGKRSMSAEREKEMREPAAVAASFLGRMYLRGEGVKKDYKRARLWLGRSAHIGSREAHNNLGVMYRDGLGVTADRDKAIKLFTKAAGLELPDAFINLGVLALERGETRRAAQLFVQSVQFGSPFSGFYHLAALQANDAHAPPDGDHGAPGSCGVAVSYYKLVSELGAWDDDYVGEANRAWARGEEDKALLGWWIAAEMGYELGQSNVAFMLNRGSAHFDEPIAADTELMLWTRSAAQGNADAMVMVGDAYYNGVGANATLNSSTPDYPRAFGFYQTAAEKHNPMAYWNLGYMYENGLGVPRDWRDAKRNYDLALEVSPNDAYLPWLLSLTRLYFRSWWIDVRSGGTTPGLALFEDDDGERKTLWEGLKALFSPRRPEGAGAPWHGHGDDFGGEGGEGGDGGDGAEDDGGYDDYSGSGWAGNRDRDAGDDDDFDTIDEIVENVLVFAVLALIMVLLWLRQQWAQWAPRPAQPQ